MSNHSRRSLELKSQAHPNLIDGEPVTRDTYVSQFETLRHEDENGEYWLARELMKPGGYSDWRNWETAIKKAKLSAINTMGETAGQNQVVGVTNMVPTGSGARREVQDWRLTRFGAYLAFQNGDPRKPEIAAAQAYFAIQTRYAEMEQAKDVVSDRLDRVESIVGKLVEAVASLAGSVAKIVPARQFEVEPWTGEPSEPVYPVQYSSGKLSGVQKPYVRLPISEFALGREIRVTLSDGSRTTAVMCHLFTPPVWGSDGQVFLDIPLGS